MNKKIVLYIFTVITIMTLGLAATVSLEAGTNKFDFTLSDCNGKKHSLSDYSDSKAVAVIWVSTRCPVSNAYNQRMEALNKEFKNKGVAFLGINSNKAESVEEIKAHADKNGFTFPVLKDDNNLVADRYEATVTPEVFLFNSKHELLYHGRIDDSARENQVSSRDFYNAMNQVLAGKEVTEKKTKAFGCTIKRIKK
jgi:peroxiredoxin